MVIWAFSPHGHLCEGMPGHPMDGQQGKGHHLPPKGHLCKGHGFSHAFDYFHKSVRTQPPPSHNNKANSAANTSDIQLLRKE